MYLSRGNQNIKRDSGTSLILSQSSHYQGISSLSQEMTQQHHQIMCCYCNSKEIEGKTETISRLQSIKLRPGNNKSWILPHIEVPLSSVLFGSPMVTNEP